VESAFAEAVRGGHARQVGKNHQDPMGTLVLQWQMGGFIPGKTRVDSTAHQGV